MCLFAVGSNNKIPEKKENNRKQKAMVEALNQLL